MGLLRCTVCLNPIPGRELWNRRGAGFWRALLPGGMEDFMAKVMAQPGLSARPLRLAAEYTMRAPPEAYSALGRSCLTGGLPRRERC